MNESWYNLGMIHFNLRARMFLTFIFCTAIPPAILFAMGCCNGWNQNLAMGTILGTMLPVGGCTLLYLSTGFQYEELTDPYK